MIQKQILQRLAAIHRFLPKNIRYSSSSNLDLEKLETESTTAIEG